MVINLESKTWARSLSLKWTSTKSDSTNSCKKWTPIFQYFFQQMSVSNSTIPVTLKTQIFSTKTLENLSILKLGHSRPHYSVYSSFQYSSKVQLIVNKITSDWIRTVDLSYRKRPLNQLCHNHCPIYDKFIGSVCFTYP